MKKTSLETINSDLFTRLSPAEELWAIGGATCLSTGHTTGSYPNFDIGEDCAYDFDEME